MKAWVIENHQDQRPTINLSEVSTPEPSANEVRVRLNAVGVNRADLLQIAGQYPAPPGYDQRIPGLEYSGIIDAVGEKVLNRKVGDAVMGLIPGGAYAEYIVTNDREVIDIPDNLDVRDAAAVPEDFLTAYRALVIEGGLAFGQWAIIRPVTSGVGLAAAQLCRAMGAKVAGTSRSQERLDLAMAYGLDLGIVETENGVCKKVIDAIGGVHVALEMVAGNRLQDSISCLRTEGMAIIIGLLGGTKSEIDIWSMLSGRRGVKAMTMRSQPLEERIRVAQIFTNQLAPLFLSSALKPIVSMRFPFDEAPAAHEAMAENRHLGKIILEM